MAAPANTYGGLTNEQRNHYEAILLPRMLSQLVMFADADKGSIPANEGLTTEWRSWAALPLAVTPLSEGVPPAESALVINKITATIGQYGAFVRATDLLVHQGIDPVWAQIYGLLGENAGATLHTVLISGLVATGGTGGPPPAGVNYPPPATTRSTITATTVMTVTEVRKAMRALASANVRRFPDNSYHCLIHPNVAFDIMTDTAWRNPNEYRGDFANNSISAGELGMLYGVKFIQSTDAPVFATAGGGGVNVYGTMFYGPGWYGIRDLAARPTPTPDPNTQKGVSVSGVPVETETKDDPLGQFGVAGWKANFVCRVLQVQRGWRWESAATSG